MSSPGIMNFDTVRFIHLKEKRSRCKAEALKESKSQGGRLHVNEEFVFAPAKRAGCKSAATMPQRSR